MGAGYRHLPKGAGAGAGQSQPALEVAVPVTGNGGTGSSFEFSQVKSILKKKPSQKTKSTQNHFLENF